MNRIAGLFTYFLLFITRHWTSIICAPVQEIWNNPCLLASHKMSLPGHSTFHVTESMSTTLHHLAKKADITLKLMHELRTYYDQQIYDRDAVTSLRNTIIPGFPKNKPPDRNSQTLDFYARHYELLAQLLVYLEMSRSEMSTYSNSTWIDLMGNVESYSLSILCELKFAMQTHFPPVIKRDVVLGDIAHPQNILEQVSRDYKILHQGILLLMSIRSEYTSLGA